MKEAHFKHGIKKLSGTLYEEELTFMSYRGKDKCSYRTYKPPTLTEHNHIIGKITRNLNLLLHSLSPEYQQQLKAYADMLSYSDSRKDKLYCTALAVFTRMMWKLKKIHPEIPLEDINRDKLVDSSYPVQTVRQAMENDFLDMIPNAMFFDAKM
jgi:hypothetical protein